MFSKFLNLEVTNNKNNNNNDNATTTTTTTTTTTNNNIIIMIIIIIIIIIITYGNLWKVVFLLLFDRNDIVQLSVSLSFLYGFFCCT